MQKQIRDKSRLFDKLFISATYIQQTQPPLMVSPHFLGLILNEAQDTPIKYQNCVINEILDLFVQRDTNSLLLYTLDETSVEVENSLLDSLIMWMVRTVNSSDEARQYLSKVQYLLAYYTTSFKNLSKLTQWLSIAFYDEKFNPTKMNFILSLIKMFYGPKRGFVESPKNFFYIYGQQNNSGIKTVQHNPQLPVKNTIFLTFCFKHLMKKAYNNHNLFRFHTEKGQKFIGYIDTNKLMLGYKAEQQKQLHLCKVAAQFLPDKWYRISIQYTVSSTIVRVNKQFQQQVKPFLSKQKQRAVKQCNFGENFHGMMCSLFMANKIPKEEDFSWEEFPYGIECWESVGKLKRSTQFFDSILFSCLPLSTFQVRYQQHCFDIFKRNHSVIGDNIAICKSPTIDCGTAMHGGIRTIVPLFYLARFYNPERYPNLLEELLQLLLTLIKKSPADQIEYEVSSDNILLVLSQHISVCHKLVTVKALHLIWELDKHFKNEINKVASIKQLLWGISFRHIYNRELVNEHYSYIEKKYRGHQVHYAQEAFSFNDIVYYMVKYFEDSASNCCLQHYMNESILNEEFSIEEATRLKKCNHQLHYEWIQSIAGQIMENYIREPVSPLKSHQHHSKHYDSIIIHVKVMLRLLLHKYSTCLYLTLLRTIKHQVNKFKDNRKFLSLLAHKCNIMLFLVYLSEKTINCDLLTEIIYLVLAVYKGSDRETQKREQVVAFLKKLFTRLKQFPKPRGNPALRAAKKGRKNSVDLYDRKDQDLVSEYEKENIINNPILTHIHRPTRRIVQAISLQENPPLSKSITLSSKEIILESMEQPVARPWAELQNVVPQNIKTWMPLYSILRNFALGILSEVQIPQTFQIDPTIQANQKPQKQNSKPSARIYNEDAVQILLYYYRICDISIKELIVKDLLQNLMIDVTNTAFYKSSFHLNSLLLEAVGKQIHRNGVIGEMALKVITSVFEQLIRTSQKIGDYYILLKSMILLKKQFFVELLYTVFKDLLSRKILKRQQLHTLLIIIEFQTLESRMTFSRLTELTILVIDQLTVQIQCSFASILSKNILEITPSLPPNSIQFLVCLQGKKSKFSVPVFESEVNTGILEQEITFNFDNVLSKILIDPNMAMVDLAKMIKRYYLFQAYIEAFRRVLLGIVRHNIKSEELTVEKDEIDQSEMMRTSNKSGKSPRQSQNSDDQIYQKPSSEALMKKNIGLIGRRRYRNKQIFSLNHGIQLIQKLANITLFYVNFKMCSDNFTSNQSGRMILITVSNIFLELMSLSVQNPTLEMIGQKAKQGFKKIWVYILKILGHFSKDKEVINYEILYNRVLDLQFNGLLVELFQYFLKEIPSQPKKQDSEYEQKISNGVIQTPIIEIPELKLISGSDNKLEQFVMSQKFRKSLMIHGNIQRVLQQCRMKNNGSLKESYLKKISIVKGKISEQLESQRNIKLTQVNQNLHSKNNIQYLFDEENSHQEQVRIKFLHQQEKQLRKFHSIWKVMWRDMRIYHKPYGFWMAQKESNTKHTFQKTKYRNFKFVMSKYSTTTGIQPILEAEIVQPWHIVKNYWKQKHKYVTSFTDMMRPSHSQKKKHHALDLGPQIKTMWKNLWKTANIFKNPTAMTTQIKTSKQYDVKWIQGNIKAKGKLFIRRDEIIFWYDGIQQQDSHLSFERFVLPCHKQTYEIWRMATMLKISRRRYLMRYSALEILLNNTKRLLFNFQNEDSEGFLNEIEKFRQQQIYNYGPKIKANKVDFYLDGWLKDVGVDESLTEAWLEGKISNLHYLVEVNNGACRNINDLSQYLVMPWVVEMNDQKQPSLRDLSKTLGALGSEDRKKIINEKFRARDPFNPVPAFFFGTHYSSPGVVFNFLIRLSPFTQYCKHLQGGKFDIADRLFSSFLSAWKSAMTEVSDVRELVPEFYYLPECMINIEDHNLGLTQCGEAVNHIELPPWSAHNPYFFTVQMRQILQSNKVSENISKWIDLIFGYKQKGKQAEEALNVYYYLTYEDYNKVQEQLDDDQIHKKSCQAQIIHFGQIPPQIFSKPHPTRASKKASQIEIGFVSKYLMMNSFKQKVVGICIKDTDMRIVKRNAIETIATNRQPAVLQKSIKFNFEKNATQSCYLLKKEAAKVVFFKNYFLVSGYLTNEFRVFNRSTGNIEDFDQLESPITYVHVNEENNLILIGTQLGIVHIYEIEYDTTSVIIKQMAMEYFPAPISHISENEGFFAISFGNFTAIYKIARSVYYLSVSNNRSSEQIFIKFFRSFRSSLPIKSAFIISSPLYAIVLCDNANIKTYSINGQFLKSINANSRNIGTLKDCDLNDLIYYIEDERVVLLSTPDLRSLSEIQIPDYLQIFEKYVLFKNWVGVLGRVDEPIVNNKSS